MTITDHAVLRFRERFYRRETAYAPDSVVREYMCKLLKRSKEIMPVTPHKETFRVNKRVVFVVKHGSVLTVLRFDPARYKAKMDKFRYLNDSSRQQRQRRKREQHRRSRGRY